MENPYTLFKNDRRSGVSVEELEQKHAALFTFTPEDEELLKTDGAGADAETFRRLKNRKTFSDAWNVYKNQNAQFAEQEAQESQKLLYGKLNLAVNDYREAQESMSLRDRARHGRLMLNLFARLQGIEFTDGREELIYNVVTGDDRAVADFVGFADRMSEMFTSIYEAKATAAEFAKVLGATDAEKRAFAESDSGRALVRKRPSYDKQGFTQDGLPYGWNEEQYNADLEKWQRPVSDEEVALAHEKRIADAFQKQKYLSWNYIRDNTSADVLKAGFRIAYLAGGATNWDERFDGVLQGLKTDEEREQALWLAQTLTPHKDGFWTAVGNKTWEAWGDLGHGMWRFWREQADNVNDQLEAAHYVNDRGGEKYLERLNTEDLKFLREHLGENLSDDEIKQKAREAIAFEKENEAELYWMEKIRNAKRFQGDEGLIIDGIVQFNQFAPLIALSFASAGMASAVAGVAGATAGAITSGTLKTAQFAATAMSLGGMEMADLHLKGISAEKRFIAGTAYGLTSALLESLQARIMAAPSRAVKNFLTGETIRNAGSKELLSELVSKLSKETLSKELAAKTIGRVVKEVGKELIVDNASETFIEAVDIVMQQAIREIVAGAGDSAEFWEQVKGLASMPVVGAMGKLTSVSVAGISKVKHPRAMFDLRKLYQDYAIADAYAEQITKLKKSGVSGEVLEQWAEAKTPEAREQFFIDYENDPRIEKKDPGLREKLEVFDKVRGIALAQIKDTIEQTDKNLRMELENLDVESVSGADSKIDQEITKTGASASEVQAGENSDTSDSMPDEQKTFKQINNEEWEIPSNITASVPELKGKIVCDTEAYAHIGSHIGELKQFGYDTAESFVSDTLSGATAIYASKSGDGFDVVADIRGGKSPLNRVVIYLKKSESGDFYDVGTAHIIRRDRYKNKNPLWERAQSIQSSEENPLAQSRAKADNVDANEAPASVNSGTKDSVVKKNLTTETEWEYDEKNPRHWKAHSPNGALIYGEWEVVDARKVKFFNAKSEAERKYQGRDRETINSQTQVYNISDKMKPVLLGDDNYADRGAPIFNVDGKVLSGNGRSLAIQTAYGLLPNASARALENGKAYRAFVEKSAKEKGIEISEDAKEFPLLRRVVKKSELTEDEIAKDTNRDVKAEYSRAEAANENSEYFGRFVKHWNPGTNGDPRVEQNREFMQKFFRAIGKESSGAIIDGATGQYTEHAAEIVNDAALAWVIGDVALTSQLFKNRLFFGGAFAGLYSMAYRLAPLRGTQYDLRNPLQSALKNFAALKRSREKLPAGKVMTWEEFKNQSEFGFVEESKLTAEEEASADILVQLFDDYSDRRKSGVARVLSSYANVADGFGRGEADLIGGGANPLPSSLLRHADAALRGNKLPDDGNAFFGSLYDRDVAKEQKTGKPELKNPATMFQRGGNARLIDKADTRLLADELGKFVPGVKVRVVDDVEAAMASEREWRTRNAIFNSELEAFKAGKHKGALHLGVPGAILRASGLNATEVTIKESVLRKHLKKHEISVEDVRNLPEALNNPLMVYEWGTKARSLIVITNFTLSDGRKITAAVKLERSGKNIEINELSSVHGKSVDRFFSDIAHAKSGGLEKALRYVDKNKAAEWLSLASAPLAVARQSAQRLRLSEIIENFKNPSTEIREQQGMPEPFPLAPRSDFAKVDVGANMPVPFAGNKKTIIEAHPELFARIGELTKSLGGKVVDAFAGAGTYTAGLGSLGVLPKGSVLNEWAGSRYVMHKMLAKNPQGVADAMRELVKRFSESEELKAFRQRLADIQSGKATKEKSTQVLVDWFNDELAGKHGVSYIDGNGNNEFGDANLKENEQSAAFYMFLQTLMTGSHPVNFKFDGNGKLFIEVADGVFRTGHLSTRLINTKGGFNENALNPEKYIKRIEAAGKIYQEAELDVRRGDGWTLAKTANRGDTVFVDPAYLGVQAYGGKKGKTAQDANSKEETIAKLADLIKWAEANGASIVYTNEYSDKSGGKGMSQEEYAEVWKEALKRSGSETAGVNYFDRDAHGMGKAGEARADIVFVAGPASYLLKPSRAELDLLKEKHGFKTDEEAEAFAWQEKTKHLSAKEKSKAEEWKNVRYQRAFHGSPHNFAAEENAPLGRFRDDKMGSGEGAQAFGWGHYLTSEEKIAREQYAERLSKSVPHGKSKHEEFLTKKGFAKYFSYLGEMGRFLDGKTTATEELAFEKRIYESVLEDAQKDVSVAQKDIERYESALERKSFIEYGKEYPFGRGDVSFAKRFLSGAKERLKKALKEEKVAKKQVDYLRKLTEEKLENWKREYETFEFSEDVLHRHLYTAELDDATLLDWTKPMTAEQFDRFIAELRKTDSALAEKIEPSNYHELKKIADAAEADFQKSVVEFEKNPSDDAQKRMDEAEAKYREAYEPILSAKRLEPLSEIHGSVRHSKDAKTLSKALFAAGFIGHKFPAASHGAGDYSKGTNYVIYDESALQIVDKVSWLKNARGKVFGAYNRATKEVFIAKNARVDTVLHELGWHATFDWAEQNAPELHGKMREYAANAPEVIKAQVRKAYPDLDEKSEAFLDEVGAHAFSLEHYGKIEDLLKTAKDKTWWGKVKQLFAKAWKAFLKAIGKDRVNVAALAEMDYKDAIEQLAKDFVNGKRLTAMIEGASRGNGGVREQFIGERRLAGEVEARNVARRLDDKHALPWRTEDVAEEEQIAIPEGMYRYGEADSAESRIAEDSSEVARIEAESKANGTWLKAPNGKPSKLNPRQWVQVRTKAFKKWFGDWEKAARIEKLKNSVPVEISGNEIAFGESVKENVKLAKQYAKNFRGEYTNKDTGNTIPVFSGSVNELSQHDRGSKAHLQSFAAIPQIIENSVYITTLANEDLSAHPGIKEFEYYVCGLKIGGVDYTVKAVVAVERNGARYYDHKLTQIEKGALLSSLSDVTKSAGKAGTPFADIKDKRLLSILQVDSSKVVDENGEPLVVYHGTDADFWMFDKRKAQDKRGRALGVGWGKGKFYFTISEAIAGTNGKRIIPAFLDVRNPVSAEEYARGIETGENRDRSIAKRDKALVIAGVDGISDVELSGGVAVFSPLQIKSATENVGTFDAGNPDIRYQREDPDPEEVSPAERQFEAEKAAGVKYLHWTAKKRVQQGAMALAWKLMTLGRQMPNLDDVRAIYPYETNGFVLRETRNVAKAYMEIIKARGKDISKMSLVEAEPVLVAAAKEFHGRETREKIRNIAAVDGEAVYTAIADVARENLMGARGDRSKARGLTKDDLKKAGINVYSDLLYSGAADANNDDISSKPKTEIRRNERTGEFYELPIDDSADKKAAQGDDDDKEVAGNGGEKTFDGEKEKPTTQWVNPKMVHEKTPQEIVDGILFEVRKSLFGGKARLPKGRLERADYMKAARLTLQQSLGGAVYDLIAAKDRQKAERHLQRMRAAQNMDTLVKESVLCAEAVRDGAIRSTRIDIARDVFAELKPFARLKERSLEQNRMRTGLSEVFLHSANKALLGYDNETFQEIEKLRSIAESTDEKISPERRERASAEADGLSLTLGFSKMSLVEMQNVLNKIVEVKESGKAELQKKIETRDAEMDKDVATLTRSIASVKRKSKSWLRENVGESVRSFYSVRQRLYDLTRYDKNPEAARAVVDKFSRDLSRAMGRKENMMQATRVKLYDAMEKSFGMPARAAAAKLSVLHKEFAKFSLNGAEALSLDQLINIYLQIRQKDYARALSEPDMQFDPDRLEILKKRVAMIPAIEEAIGEDGIAYANALCELKSDILPELQKAYAEETGFGFVEPDEEFYFPLRRDYGSGAEIRAGGGNVLSALPKQYTARTISDLDIIENDSATRVLLQTQSADAHFIAYHKPFAFARKMFGDKAFVNAVKKHSGTSNDREVSKELDGLSKHLYDVFSPSGPETFKYPGSAVLDALLSSTATVALGMNPLTTIRNVPAVVNYLRELDFKDFLSATNPVGVVESLRDMMSDPAFKSRWGNFQDEELQKIMNTKMVKGEEARVARGVLKKIALWYMSNNQAGDSIAILWIGQGLYRALRQKYIKEGADAEAAKRKALDEVIYLTEQTQLTRDVQNKSTFARRAGKLGQVVGMFTREAQGMFAANTQALTDFIANPTREKWNKLVRTWTATAVNAFLFGFIAELFRLAVGDDDEEELFDEESRKRMYLSMLGSVSSGWILFGGMIYSLFDSNPYKTNALPGTSVITNIGRGSRKAWRAWEESDDAGEGVADALDEFAEVMIPVYRIYDKAFNKDDSI